MLPCCAPSLEYRVRLGAEMGFLTNETPKSSISEIAHQLQAAEFFQLFFFGSQAILYALALRGVISPLVPGITTLGLMPIQVLAYHRSMILYGKESRRFLALVAAFSLTLIAAFSIRKMPGDYAFTMCGGAFVVHIIRLTSERSDFKEKKADFADYQSKKEEISSCFTWNLDSIKDRVEKARYAQFIHCSNTEAITLAKKIQYAELFQLLYFTGLTILFGLTLKGLISPVAAGICTLALLPLQTYANYLTMVLNGKKNRNMLTLAMTISMAATGIFSLLGYPGNYTWMLCMGNLLYHAIRITTERSDYRKALA